jgi:Arc/MetJ-type ribon-helix-helix transcriptional regulator
MHRIQVQLTAEQERRLKELAKLRGASISALIREGVDRLLDPARRAEDERWARATAVVGSVKGPAGDVAEDHDAWFADAIAEKKLRRH